MKRKITPIAITIAFETFADIEDPRIDRRKLHPLMNVLVMALCGAITGANGWEELAEFAEAYEEWFADFLDVTNGTPSADTFRRVFEALDPLELENAIRRWVATVAESFKGEVVAIDGKALKGAVDKAHPTTPLHLLHVWAAGQQLLLGQQCVEGAPGEIAAIPEMLRRLRVEGAIITTDANGCTKAVAEAVREAKADYVLALKGNRGPIHQRVVQMFAAAESRHFRGVRSARSAERGHGREEKRTVYVLPFDDEAAEWRDARCAAMIERSRTIDGETSSERHYYICSLAPDAKQIGAAIRAHWGIENNLHWQLDVTFDEDSRKIRDERSAANFALISRLALMMLKRSPERLSINLKRKRATWRPDFLAKLLTGGI